ncbi:MAG TPA: ROK family protein, partial [Gaiellaceae bacterium]|nr:ROK family protein [Gaiellaceae bacterium]
PTRRDSIGQLIDQLCGLHSDAAASEPLPWALCTAGIVDTARGRILWSGNLGLEDEPIVERLAEVGSRPRFIVNDVDAAAVGEAAGGTLALLQIGSGVAGRIVVDGATLSSAHGYGGEVGHLVYLPGGRPCNCGLAGCVEAYAGMTTIRKRYSELGRTAPSAQQVLADAASDRDASELLDDALSAIAFAAAVAVIAYDPGTLRLGGGVAAAWGEKLRAAVESGVADRVPPGLSRRTRFELSRLGERAPLLGLLHLAKST